MGTYTTNYSLFMPTVGEQGWGELVNGNFSTIDTTMKGLDTRVGTLGGRIETLDGRIETLDGRIGTLETEVSALEGVSNGGNIVSKSITNSGTITSTGLITANGGITGKFVISSLSTNANNVKVCTVSDSAKTWVSGSPYYQTLGTSTVSVTRYNTGILTCTKTDSELKASTDVTCTITATYSGSSSGYLELYVKNSSGTTIASKQFAFSNGATTSFTFTRNLNSSYTVGTGGTGVTYTVSAANVSFHVP